MVVDEIRALHWYYDKKDKIIIAEISARTALGEQVFAASWQARSGNEIPTDYADILDPMDEGYDYL